MMITFETKDKDETITVDSINIVITYFGDNDIYINYIKEDVDQWEITKLTYDYLISKIYGNC